MIRLMCRADVTVLCGTGRCCRALRTVCVLALLTLVAASGSNASRPPVRGLVPASFGNRLDSLGFVWDIDQHGRIRHGTNYAFSHAQGLQINNNSFSPSQSQMTADGSELIFTGVHRGNLHVTRRVKVDTKTAGVRYVELIQNTSSAPVTVQLVVYTQMNSQFQAWMSDTGTASPTVLGKKDSGIVIFQQQNRPTVVMVLAAPGAKQKPTLQIQNNYQIRVTYTLTVAPGKTAGVTHSIAQRHLVVTSDAKALRKLTKPFLASRWQRDLPRTVRAVLTNTRGGGGALSPTAEGFAERLEAYGTREDSADILMLGDTVELHGRASAATPLSISSGHGRIDVDLADIAAICGPKYTGSEGLVFLRDGQVLVGELGAGTLLFSLQSGVQMDIAIARLDRLMLRANKDDGHPPAKAIAFLTTVFGDRLALAASPEARIPALTPWGALSVPLAETRRISAIEGELGSRLSLVDGTRVFAFLQDVPLRVATTLFGEIEIPAHRVQAYSNVQAASGQEDDDDDEEIAHPVLELAGDSRLVGQPGTQQIQLRAGGQVVSFAPQQIKSLENLSAGDEDLLHSRPSFEAELWNDSTVSGYALQTLIAWQCAGQTFNVPLDDVIRIAIPAPKLAVTMNDNVAQFIRDLGHPDWKKREAASQQLADIGPAAKPMLQEALRQTVDAEVRRRVRDLLEGIGE